MKLPWILSASLVVVAACKKDEDKPKTDPAPADDPAPAAKAPDAAAAPAAADEVIRLDQAGFDTPESVLYDVKGDAYLVSNIGGTPLDKDDNGFISKVSPDGKVELKWIDSAKDDVTLNAPKGSAIVGDVLYVADIDVVRMFDRGSGAPKGEIPIAGATFLNDVAADDKTVWVSDSGLNAKFEPSGTDAIYAIAVGAGNKVEKVITGKELGHPNGLAISGDGVRVVTFGSGETYEIVRAGGKVERKNVAKPPKGQLDGVIVAAGTPTLISSWEGKAVYAMAEDGAFSEVITGVESPADIGYDSQRKRLLVPLFTKGSVEIHPMK